MHLSIDALPDDALAAGTNNTMSHANLSYRCSKPCSALFPLSDMLVVVQCHAATQLSASMTCHAQQSNIAIAEHQVLVRTIAVFAM